MTTKTDAVRADIAVILDWIDREGPPAMNWQEITDCAARLRESLGLPLSPAASPDATPAAKPETMADHPAFCPGCETCEAWREEEKRKRQAAKPDAPGGEERCLSCEGLFFGKACTFCAEKRDAVRRALTQAHGLIGLLLEGTMPIEPLLRSMYANNEKAQAALGAAK